MSWLHIGRIVFVPALILIPLAIGALRFRHLAVASRRVWYYLLLTGLFEFASLVLWFRQINNVALVHLYTLIEFTIISLYFYAVFRVRSRRHIVLIVLAVFALACVLNSLFLQPLQTFPSNTRSLEVLLICAYCFFYFFERLKESGPGKQAERQGYDWFAAGLLLYFSSSIFLWLFGQEFRQYSFAIRNAFMIIMYVLLAIGFIRCKKERIMPVSFRSKSNQILEP
jgi:hypothetical protein